MGGKRGRGEAHRCTSPEFGAYGSNTKSVPLHLGRFADAMVNLREVLDLARLVEKRHRKRAAWVSLIAERIPLPADIAAMASPPPDPHDRSVTKRWWEVAVARWVKERRCFERAAFVLNADSEI